MIEKKLISNLKNVAKKGIDSVDMNVIREKASATTSVIVDKAADVKDAAISMKEDISDKINELDRMLEDSITEYNDAYTIMSDKGLQLFIERTRACDSIALVETIVNSIANSPKSFETDIEEISTYRQRFTETCEFADRQLQEARNSAVGAGAGVAAGASVAFMAPSAAMWVATTFGTASTGTAISTLSGAAATNAALAWLGGGALTAGGKGIVAGKAFLAMAGPIGLTIAGATLLSSILLFTTKRTKLNKEKNEEIQAVKDNVEIVREMELKINDLLSTTVEIHSGVNQMAIKSLALYSTDYSTLGLEQKQLLGALVNNTKTLATICSKTLGE